MPDEPTTPDGASDANADGQDKSQPAMHEVVVDGEKSQVGLDKLISSYQQDSSYTQKSQKLAEDRGKFDTMVNDKATQMYMEALANGDDNGGRPADGTENTDPNESSTAKLQELEERIGNAEKLESDKASDAEMNKTLDALKEKFPDMDREKVMIKFYHEAKEGTPVEDTFANLAEESHKAAVEFKQSIIDGYVKSKTVNPHDAGEIGHGQSPPEKKIEPAKTFEEARDRAEARLKTEGY